MNEVLSQRYKMTLSNIIDTDQKTCCKGNQEPPNKVLNWDIEIGTSRLPDPSLSAWRYHDRIKEHIEIHGHEPIKAGHNDKST